MQFPRNFGRIVRERRMRKGMTIKELSELCDMSDRGLELIELGDSDPKLSNVLSIARVLGMDMGELNACIPAIVWPNVDFWERRWLKIDSKYIVVCSTYVNGDKTRSAYGIALVNDSDVDTVILRSYYDLTPDASKAEELACSCNRYKVEPIHLADIIEDFLA